MQPLVDLAPRIGILRKWSIMRPNPGLFVIVICILLVSMPILGRAFLPGVVAGGSVSLGAHSRIRMEAAQTTIRLGPESFTVDAVFHLFNPGETTTEKVGYPKRGFFNDLDFIGFTARVDGKKLDVLTEEHNEGLIKVFEERMNLFLRARCGIIFVGTTGHVIRDRWLVHRVSFPAHDRTTLRITYESRYDCSEAHYFYGTASYWGDRIGRTTILVDSTDVGAPEMWRFMMAGFSRGSL